MKRKQNKKHKKPSRLFVVASITFIGLVLLAFTSAATSFVSLEPEGGNITPTAQPLSTSSASGGQAIVFGAVTSSNSGCNFNGVAAPCIGPSGQGASGWGNTVFQDEFNGSSLDTSKWAPCWFPKASTSGPDICGDMNNSLTLKSNVRVEEGNVILRQSTVIENSVQDHGALIKTLPSQVDGPGFTMTDGYFAEARVFFPGNGSKCYNWPAWWINGPIDGYTDGEIDVAEIGGSGDMGSNYHYDRGGDDKADNNDIPGYWCDDYHIYGVDRRDGQNVVYFDGEEVVRYPTYDNGAPQYLIFNVGYRSGKTPKAGPESDVKIDYVRVWKK